MPRKSYKHKPPLQSQGLDPQATSVPILKGRPPQAQETEPPTASLSESLGIMFLALVHKSGRVLSPHIRDAMCKTIMITYDGSQATQVGKQRWMQLKDAAKVYSDGAPKAFRAAASTGTPNVSLFFLASQDDNFRRAMSTLRNEVWVVGSVMASLTELVYLAEVVMAITGTPEAFAEFQTHWQPVPNREWVKPAPEGALKRLGIHL